jgi:hypothetical protein
MTQAPDILTGADRYNSPATARFKYTPGSKGELSGSGSGDETHPEIKAQQKSTAKNRIGSFLFFTFILLVGRQLIRRYLLYKNTGSSPSDVCALRLGQVVGIKLHPYAVQRFVHVVNGCHFLASLWGLQDMPYIKSPVHKTFGGVWKGL